MPPPRRSQRNVAASSTTNSNNHAEPDPTPEPKRRSSQRTRQSPRGNAGFMELAESIVRRQQNVVFITGAGLSVASGVRPFRSSGSGGRKNARNITTDLPPLAGIWDEVVYTTATRAAFRRDPMRWYNEFWIPHFYNTPGSPRPVPNSGHLALDALMKEHGNIRQVTQK